jgi:hypothetical protein
MVMNEMNRKKLYIWKLGTFLNATGMKMSGGELAEHLNRNKFKTGYETEYSGERGTYTLIEATYDWVHDTLGLPDEAAAVAEAYVNKAGGPAWAK